MTDWPHAPPHRILEKGTYIVTAGTHNKQFFFKTTDSLNMLYDEMLSIGKWYNINFNAWALMANHYHIIVSVDNTDSLKKSISSFHRNSSILLNKIDNTKGRKVWYNFWDTQITYQKSYYARLNYVNNNPVHHGIVEKAEEYKWCSEAYYKYNLDPAYAKTVKSFHYDNLNVFDEF